MAVLTELRDRFPALDGWLMQVQGLLDPRRVLLAPDDEALHLAWCSQDSWELAKVDLPPDLCRSGQPSNRDALGEMIADLLLERGMSPPRWRLSCCCLWPAASGVCLKGPPRLH